MGPRRGLSYGSVDKIEGSGAEFWFDTSNAEWMTAQRDYMTQIMNVVSEFDNVTVDVINEAGRNNSDGSVGWRIATHSWLADNWPGFIYQSQSYGGGDAATPRIASDEDVRAFGAQSPNISASD